MKKSVQYTQALISIKDSIYSKEKVVISEELNEKYNTALNQAQIAESKLLLAKERSFRNLLLFSLGLLLLLILAMLLWRNSRKKMAEHRISVQNEKIKALEQRQKLLALDYIVQGQEEERQRIAQDLHDGLGGLLTSVRFQILAIQEKVKSLDNSELGNRAETMISKACDEVRRISHDMMPASLMSLGLQDTLEDTVVELNQSHQFKTKLVIAGELDKLPKNVQVNLFRIIQEAINNVIKHAQAKWLEITIQAETDIIVLKIQDDGIGAQKDSGSRPEGIGIQNIKSRVAYLGGEWQIDGTDGTTILITIPKQ